MKAVIMAGGFGTRIQPLTSSMPKPMLDVVNIPMTEHILKKCKNAGIRDVVILLFFKPEIIKNYFGNGEKWGMNISYVLPDGDYGTAGAVGQARDILGDESFIIISGDLVTDFDLNEIIKFHKKKESLLTITLTPVDNPLQFGVVITDENSQIIRFLEKPSWGEVFSDTINTGIYVLEPEILNYIPTTGDYDFSKNLFPTLMENNIKLWGCPIEGYWRDVGNPQSYREVHQDILSGKIDFELEGKVIEYPNGTLYTKTDKLPENLTIVGKVIIDEDVELKNNTFLENSAIGKNTKIGKNSKIQNSVIWSDSKIGKNCEINNSVICNNVIIKDEVEIKKGAVIAENVKILSNVEILKDITIWPNKIIEKGAIVSQNVVWGDKYRANIFNKGKVVGSANLELTGEMSDKIAEAFASIFPEGSKIYVSRDYHQASRMLKRFVVGGILAVGLEVLDLKAVPAAVLRHKIQNDNSVVGGIHIRQSITEPYKTEMSFYTSDGMPIDSKITDAVERIYFREQFRRVNYDKIGSIKEIETSKKEYIKDLKNLVGSVKLDNMKIAVDLMHGMTSDIYPQILKTLDIDTIMLNAYPAADRLVEISNEVNEIQNKLSSIVSSLKLNAGVLLYPNGEKLDLIDENGYIIEKETLLLIVLKLLNMDNKTYKIFLPAWAPDFIENELQNLAFSKGKVMGKNATYLKEFDLIADINGGLAFTEFGVNRDALYSSIKIIKLLAKHNISLKEIKESLPKFFYTHLEVDVPADKKGTIMRKFLESSENKESSHNDGIKIYENNRDWILMIPDDYEERVHLYVQAENGNKGDKIIEDYKQKIAEWIK